MKTRIVVLVLVTCCVLCVASSMGQPANTILPAQSDGAAHFAQNPQDIKIANDVAQLVYDILGRFNVTGVLSILGGGGFLCYWLLKFLTNKFPGFGSSAIGQFITLVIRAEAKQLTPAPGPTVPPRLEQELKG